MPGTMKAFVMRRIGEVAMMDKPVPEPGPNDAIVKTTAALVCTSDTRPLPGWGERMKRLLRLIEQGRVDPTPMTTHRFSFDEVEQAFTLMKTKSDGIIKPLILFD